MTAIQKLPKRISVRLPEEAMKAVSDLSEKSGISRSKVIKRIVSEALSLEPEQSIYKFVCSECLKTVKKIYQGDRCRACLNKTFVRLRKVIDIPAKQNLRESKGE